jgi:hypothetical protein
VRKTSLAFPVGVLVVAVAAVVTAIKTVLRLPGIPYNVAELFLDRASVLAVSFFALGVLWVGAGATVVAFVLAKSRKPYLVLPIALVLVSLASKMLVSRGITYESLDDILGTNNLFGLVTQQGIWGNWWRTEFLQLGVDVVDFVERRVRYCALYSIPVIAIALTLLPRARRTQSQPLSGAALSLSALVAMLWLWLCTTIVLTWAATDNLTELIAGRGPLGIPGPIFLFALIVLMAMNVEVLLRARRSLGAAIVAVLASAACVVATWFLLNAGLEQQVHKYSFVFSGTQFLLGPDRQHGLSGRMLFARWGLVYAGAVGVVTVGVWIAESTIAGVRATWANSRRSAVPEAP